MKKNQDFHRKIYCFLVFKSSFSRKFGRRDVRKGMVLVDQSVQPQACTKFDAEVFILHHPTTIMTNYQAMSSFSFFILFLI